MSSNRVMTAEQEAMISCPSPLRACLAGPGSGKTTTLVELVGRLNPEQLKRTALLTFTRAGANEIKRRMKPDTDLMFSGTTHSYCNSLLQREGTRIGLKKNLTIIDDDSEAELLQECMEELSYKGEASLVRAEIERNPKAFPPSAPLLREDALRVAKLYHQKMFEAGQLDFDAMLTYGKKLLMTSQVTWRPWMLIVDEAQDSAKIEWEIYRLIGAERMVFLGDVDQAIFQWRGAMPQELLDFSRHPKTKLHLLTLNHRSGPELCQAATKLIEHNVDRQNKPIVSVRSSAGREVHEIGLDDRMKEMQYILQWVKERQKEDIGILVRTGDQRKAITEMLEKASLKVQGTADRPRRLSEAIAYAAAAGDPANDGLVFQAIRRKRGKAAATLMKQQARRRSIPLAGLLLEEELPFFPEGWYTVNGLSVIPARTGHEAFEEFLRETNHLLDFGDEVAAMAKEILPLATETTDLSELAIMLKEEIDAKKKEGIWLSTIHRSKGLEFDYVLLPFWTQGVFPWFRMKGEEDRRTAFVALTRARRECFITWTRATPMKGGTQATEKSQFIREMQLPAVPLANPPLKPATAIPEPANDAFEKGEDDAF